MRILVVVGLLLATQPVAADTTGYLGQLIQRIPIAEGCDNLDRVAGDPEGRLAPRDFGLPEGVLPDIPGRNQHRLPRARNPCWV